MMAERLEQLLAELDLAEQISLLAGRDFWHTNGVERLGVQPMRLSDGPVGVRGERTVGSSSVSFPCGAAIGATFDPEAASALGEALADECFDKGVHVLLGPTINIQRHPLGGRHFESYSEDPVLTGELAVAYVNALQARGVAATVKHYVGNDTEFQRHTISSEIGESVLAALYLLPFETAVAEATPWAVMTAYNRVNGTYAAEHGPLITGRLRGEWGFDGLVMSDWFGAQSTVPSALAGLDLEMPGPPVHYGDRLAEAVADGSVPEAVIAERARRVLQLAGRTGALDEMAPGEIRGEPERTVGARRELSRQLATRSFVLLRNEVLLDDPVGEAQDATAVLPLDLRPGSLLAVVGPSAATTAGQGGGSAKVYDERTVSVLEGLREAYEPLGVEVAAEIGCVTWGETPDLNVAVHLEYFVLSPTGSLSSFEGPAVFEEDSPRPPLMWMGAPLPEVAELAAGDFAVRVSAEFTPEFSGDYELSLSQVGKARLYVDDELVVEGSAEAGRRFFGAGSAEASGTVTLEAGTSHQLLAEYEVAAGSPLAGLFIGMRPPLPADDELIERATALARRADAVVCVLGTGPEWETEGHDRASMDLPGRQDDLARSVLAANPKSVVVLNTGSPVTMDWADDAAAILQAWFGGEEIGRAVADVLSGADEPGGRLPHTVPVRLEDTPAFPYYPGDDGKAPYGEGLLVGYRHYATDGPAPRYWFGHGLGYTSFEVTGLALNEADDDELHVVARISNLGERRGSAILQSYLAPLERSEGQPALQFIGSGRYTLSPEEAADAVLRVPRSRLGGLRLAPGRYRVMAGWSSEPAGLDVAGELTIPG